MVKRKTPKIVKFPIKRDNTQSPPPISTNAEIAHLLRMLVDQTRAGHERLTHIESAANRMQQSIDRLEQTLRR